MHLQGMEEGTQASAVPEQRQAEMPRGLQEYTGLHPQGRKILLHWTWDVSNGWTADARLPWIQQYEQIKTCMNNKWYEFITNGRVVICITVRVKKDKPYSHWARALKYLGPAVSVTLWHLLHRWMTAAPDLFQQLILNLTPWFHLPEYNQLQLAESYVLILW